MLEEVASRVGLDTHDPAQRAEAKRILNQEISNSIDEMDPDAALEAWREWQKIEKELEGTECTSSSPDTLPGP